MCTALPYVRDVPGMILISIMSDMTRIMSDIIPDMTLISIMSVLFFSKFFFKIFKLFTKNSVRKI